METYITKITHNILLNYCSDGITETSIERVNDAWYFSISCDEASYTSDKEQLFFCLRYVDINGEIFEDLKFVPCKPGLAGNDLFKEVDDILNELKLDLSNKGYNGAGAVSDVVNGLPPLILKENEKVLYTYYANHRPNLGISASYK